MVIDQRDPQAQPFGHRTPWVNAMAFLLPWLIIPRGTARARTPANINRGDGFDRPEDDRRGPLSGNLRGSRQVVL